MTVHIREALRTITGSTLRYLPVNVSTLPSNYYYPNAPTADQNSSALISDPSDAGQPFKGLHIISPCNVTIIGVDNEVITIALTTGHWPYGGIGLSKIGSDATNIILLY